MFKENAARHHLAIVEDDRALREELVCFFEDSGYLVYETTSLEGLLEILQKTEIHVVLLDLNLPQQSGFDIAQTLRERFSDIGIIILSARNQLEDRVLGYERGADIYLQKPTDPQELLAAVASIERRLNVTPETSWVLDRAHHRLTHQEQGLLVHLNPLEVAILRELMLARERQLSFADLLHFIDIHFPDRASTRRSLENVMSRLRQKTLHVTQQNGRAPLVKSVRNVGYQLTCPLKIKES